MSKYAALSERFAALSGEEWRASFAELETLLGFALPKAARAGRVWWSNDPGKSHSRAWTAHGWEVRDVDPAAEQVAFRRSPRIPDEAPSPAAPVMAESPAPMPAKRARGGPALVAASVALVAGALIARGLARRR